MSKKSIVLSAIASAMSVFNDRKALVGYCRATQHKPIPKKTGNVLVDTINEINSYMIFKGLRYPPAHAKAMRKKGAKHGATKKIRSVCQLRASRLAIA